MRRPCPPLPPPQVFRNCEWHEKQFHASGGAVLKAMSEDPSAATSDLDIKDELALEVKMASKALHTIRKAKISEARAPPPAPSLIFPDVSLTYT